MEPQPIGMSRSESAHWPASSTTSAVKGSGRELPRYLPSALLPNESRGELPEAQVLTTTLDSASTFRVRRSRRLVNLVDRDCRHGGESDELKLL